MSVSLPLFLNGRGCYRGSPNCRACRSDHQQAWREAQTGKAEFECPFGLPTNWPAMAAPEDKKCFRAELTLANITEAMGAILTRPKVSADDREARLAACAACDMRCTDKDGDFCGIGCGCGVGGARPVMLRVAKAVGIDADLTAYSEISGALCKHPKRHLGKGWKL